jgi:hypothetical protein
MRACLKVARGTSSDGVSPTNRRCSKLSDLFVTSWTPFPLLAVRDYMRKDQGGQKGGKERRERKESHKSRPALGYPIVLYKGLLHRQHEIRRQALDCDGPRGWLEPSIRIELMDPCCPVRIGFLRLKIVVSLLATLGFLGNAEVLVDDGDEHL